MPHLRETILFPSVIETQAQRPPARTAFSRAWVWHPLPHRRAICIRVHTFAYTSANVATVGAATTTPVPVEAANVRRSIPSPMVPTDEPHCRGRTAPPLARDGIRYDVWRGFYGPANLEWGTRTRQCGANRHAWETVHPRPSFCDATAALARSEEAVRNRRWGLYYWFARVPICAPSHGEHATARGNGLVGTCGNSCAKRSWLSAAPATSPASARQRTSAASNSGCVCNA